METVYRWRIVHKNLYNIMQPVINTLQLAPKILAAGWWQSNETEL
jgi:hypothetical protein